MAPSKRNMHINEIKQFAAKVNNNREFSGKQVAIKNREGKYLMFVGRQPTFVIQKTRAHVFDYTRDKVGEQIEIVNAQHPEAGWTVEEMS